MHLRAALGLSLACAGPLLAADPVLVQTTSLSLRDDVTAPIDPARRRFGFKASTKRDPTANRVVAPPPGGAADPSVAGAMLSIENAAGSGERVQIALPAAGWRRLSTSAKPRGWAFKDAAPGAPVTRVTLKNDLLSAKGGRAGFEYTLDEPQQGRVGVRLQIGPTAWCAEAPARPSGNPPSTARSDLPGRFTAQPKSPPPAACAVAPPGFALAVQNGYGSGTYPVGAVVHVWAAVRPQDQLVTGWTGDAALLAEPEEWHTTLVMPARDVSVGAAVVDRPVTLAVSQFTGVTTREKTVRSLIPPGARGLVLFLHGTGGSASFITNTEAFPVALRALESGYGVLGTEAEEAVAGDLNGDGKERWDAALSPLNTDLGNLDALVASLRAAGAIGPDAPLFAIGMSNGGSMAVTLGAVGSSPVAAVFPALRFGAVISHCASGRDAAANVTATPTAFYMCQNDDNPEVDNADAAAKSAAIAARGVPSVYAEHPPSPLYDERFLRAELPLATSQSLAAELRAAGFVGEGGFFTTPSDAIVAAVVANPALLPALVGLPPASQRRVVDQVKAMEAEHQMFSDWARRAVAFFEARTP